MTGRVAGGKGRSMSKISESEVDAVAVLRPEYGGQLQLCNGRCKHDRRAERIISIQARGNKVRNGNFQSFYIFSALIAALK